MEWIRCWKQSETNGAQLIIIHNYDRKSDQEAYRRLCNSQSIVYIPRFNYGYDIGAFQDLCRNRLPDVPRDWDTVLWSTDDWIPMSKDFVSQYTKPLDNGFGLVCTEISETVKHHVRTSGFAVKRQTAEKLRFISGRISTKEECWSFEHRGGKNTLMNQILTMGLKITHVNEDISKAPLWDMEHRKHFNRMNEHNLVFRKDRIPSDEVFIVSYTNVVKSYCDTRFFDNLYILSNGNHVYIADNSIGTEYYRKICDYCSKYENFTISHLEFPIDPKESVFQRRVIGCINFFREIFLSSNSRYFMTVESDVFPPIDILNRFKKSIAKLPEDWGMLGALYHGYEEQGGGGFHDLKGKVNGLHQPEQVLCGCTIYNRQLLEKHPFRWSKEHLGHFHDYFITEDAKEFTFWDDRDIKCGHEPSKSITEKDIR